MAITPQDIEQQTFSPSKHGYNTEEVDTFLEQLSSEVSTMLQKIHDLKSRLTSTEQQLAAAQAQVAQLEEKGAAPAASLTAPAPAADYGITERQISQALIVAQQAAEKVVADARDNADRIRNEADQKAREVIRQALAEKQTELEEIDRLKASREEFRSEYKKLLQHFIDDADAVFPKGTAAYQPVAAPAPAPAPAPAAAPAPAPAATDFGAFGDLD